MKRISLILVFILTATLGFAQAKKKTTAKSTPVKTDNSATGAGVSLTANAGGTKAADTAKAKSKKPKLPKKDGFLYKESVADTIVPYAPVNEEDVIYTKRVWRMIDFRDKGNQALKSPKVNLIGTIYAAVNKGELDMYAIDDEDFQRDAVNLEKDAKIKAKYNSKGDLSDADVAFLGENSDGSSLNSADNEFFAQRFAGVRIKEDWILDIKRGIFEPRIVGVAPIRMDVKERLNPDGSAMIDATGKPLPADTLMGAVGWFYFDDLRNVLSKQKIANDGNDNSGITFDDVFLRRLFYSNLTKTSNSADLRIEDLEINGRKLTQKERLFEAERLKKYMADFEQGLWEY